MNGTRPWTVPGRRPFLPEFAGRLRTRTPFLLLSFRSTFPFALPPLPSPPRRSRTTSPRPPEPPRGPRPAASWYEKRRFHCRGPLPPSQPLSRASRDPPAVAPGRRPLPPGSGGRGGPSSGTWEAERGRRPWGTGAVCLVRPLRLRPPLFALTSFRRSRRGIPCPRCPPRRSRPPPWAPPRSPRRLPRGARPAAGAAPPPPR